MPEFTHLHVHTQYSLLDGAAPIDKLIYAVKNDGGKAVAITDHGNMFGVPKFVAEAKKKGVLPVVGCEFYLAHGRQEDWTKRVGEGKGIEVARIGYVLAMFGFALASIGYGLAMFGYGLASIGYGLAMFGYGLATFRFALASIGYGLAMFRFALASIGYGLAMFGYALGGTIFNRVLFVDKCMIL